MNGLSDLLQSLPDSAVSTILNQAANANWDDVLPLAGGEPKFPIPRGIISALTEFDENLVTKYSAFKGHELLLKLIQKKLSEYNNINASLNEIIVVPGGSFAIYAALMAVTNAGDEVLVSDPCWEHYLSIISLSRAKPVRFNMTFDGKRYCADINHLKSVISSNTKAILLNTPLNPIGSNLSKDEILAISEICKQKNIWLIVDEEYESFIYDDKKHISAASLDDKVITLFSFSKSFALTGLRLGYVAGPSEVINLIRRFGLYSYMYPPSPSQCMAINVLSGNYKLFLENVKRIYQNKMDRCFNAIKDIPGVECWRPEGGVYLFPKLKIRPNINIAEKLIEEYHLLCVPGYVAGKQGENNIRLFIGVEDHQLDEAANRLDSFMTKYKKL